MTEPAEHPFWRYSLALYGRDGVADACLRLQERLGADVNLLLFGCWVASVGAGRVPEPAWRRLAAETAGWRHDVLRPLREVRRRLKYGTWPGVRAEPTRGLRDAVKETELLAEYAEQLAIAELFPIDGDASAPVEQRATDTAANVENYIGILSVTAAAADREDVALIVRETRQMLAPRGNKL